MTTIEVNSDFRIRIEPSKEMSNEKGEMNTNSKEQRAKSKARESNILTLLFAINISHLLKEF
jgi:hypothetical protein